MREPAIVGDVPRKIYDLLLEYNSKTPLEYWECSENRCPICKIGNDVYDGLGCDDAVLLDILVRAYNLGRESVKDDNSDESHIARDIADIKRDLTYISAAVSQPFNLALVRTPQLQHYHLSDCCCEVGR